MHSRFRAVFPPKPASKSAPGISARADIKLEGQLVTQRRIIRTWQATLKPTDVQRAELRLWDERMPSPKAAWAGTACRFK